MKGAALLLSRFSEREAAELLQRSTSSYSLLLELVSSSAPGAAPAPDTLILARLRGKARFMEMLHEEGGYVGAPGAMQLLGITRQALSKRRKTGGVLGVPMTEREYVYPVWQFKDGRVRTGIPQTLRALPSDGRTQLRFFLLPHPGLGGVRPLDALKAGRLEEVLDAAAAEGKQVAA
jgi:hypothetical protein